MSWLFFDTLFVAFFFCCPCEVYQMEPAKQYRVADPTDKTGKALQEEREVQDWETKLGKTIFYVTCATAIWFFYWFNGIQCPC